MPRSNTDDTLHGHITKNNARETDRNQRINENENFDLVEFLFNDSNEQNEKIFKVIY